MKNRYCIITDKNGRVMTFEEEGQIAYPASIDAYWDTIRITTIKNAKKIIERSMKWRKKENCPETKYLIKPIEFDHDIVIKNCMTKCEHIYLPYYDPYDHLGFDCEVNKCVLCGRESIISETYETHKKRKFKDFERIRELLK